MSTAGPDVLSPFPFGATGVSVKVGGRKGRGLATGGEDAPVEVTVAGQMNGARRRRHTKKGGQEMAAGRRRRHTKKGGQEMAAGRRRKHTKKGGQEGARRRHRSRKH